MYQNCKNITIPNQIPISQAVKIKTKTIKNLKIKSREISSLKGTLTDTCCLSIVKGGYQINNNQIIPQDKKQQKIPSKGNLNGDVYPI